MNRGNRRRADRLNEAWSSGTSSYVPTRLLDCTRRPLPRNPRIRRPSTSLGLLDNRPDELPSSDSIVRSLTYGLPLTRPNSSRVTIHDRSKPVVPSKTKKKRSMLTQARRDALLEVFNAFDVDQGGSIDADEFRAIGQSYSGRKWTNKEAREAMAKVDTDGGGEIEPDEFIVYFEDNVGFMTDKQFQARMNKLLMAAREARMKHAASQGQELPDPLGDRTEIGKLIEGLQDASDEARLEASTSMCEMAQAQRFPRGSRPTSAIVEAGAVEPLVELLHQQDPSGSMNSEDTRATAALTLKRLATRHRKNQDAIRTCGGVPLLVKMLYPQESERVQHSACATLAALVENNVGNTQAARLSEGVPDLVRLSSSPTKVVRINASSALRSMKVLPPAKTLRGADQWEGLRRNTWH